MFWFRIRPWGAVHREVIWRKWSVGVCMLGGGLCGAVVCLFVDLFMPLPVFVRLWWRRDDSDFTLGARGGRLLFHRTPTPHTHTHTLCIGDCVCTGECVCVQESAHSPVRAHSPVHTHKHSYTTRAHSPVHARTHSSTHTLPPALSHTHTPSLPSLAHSLSGARSLSASKTSSQKSSLSYSNLQTRPRKTNITVIS